MVYIYCSLIINGRRTFESVPVNLKEAVREELFYMGLGTDGKPLPVEPPVEEPQPEEPPVEEPAQP
ncbi:hypothetical protein L479_02341 [Exiguobacterium sp. S17]|nr:hypothetical protein L479_02341 [Exiguobacterium sp. S17]